MTPERAATRKVLTLEQLLEFRRAAREAGRTVVHCHGCFDIVHPGHIHHLQHARSLGDMLVVSVSSDLQVNKGIDRPLIPDDLRAASLAALECVDRVYLNPHPTAVELISALQPDVFVKGSEYETSTDPRFTAERDAVERNGGRVIFSSGDVVYSSTALIGTMRSLSEPFNEEKITRFRQRHALETSELHQVVKRFRGQRVVVVGDYILDRYHFCDATGVAGEAPVMALRALDQHDFDGGAAVIASHLAGLGAIPTLVTTTADDEPAHRAGMRLGAAGIDVCGSRVRRQTLVKHRYLVDGTKVFKVDEGSVASLDSRNETEMADQIVAAASAGAGAAAVVFADFGYGAITAGLLDRVMSPLRARVPVITADVSGRQSNLLRFAGLDLLCPTEREVREALHDNSSGLGAVVSRLLQATRTRQAIITLGKQGLCAFDWPEPTPEASDYRLRSEYLPAVPGARVVDALGCGDALLATASLALAVGASLPAAALLGSMAAAFEVGQLGNVALKADDLLAFITSEHTPSRVPAVAAVAA